jgi:hypothetical protein
MLFALKRNLPGIFDFTRNFPFKAILHGASIFIFRTLKLSSGYCKRFASWSAPKSFFTPSTPFRCKFSVFNSLKRIFLLSEA